VRSAVRVGVVGLGDVGRSFAQVFDGLAAPLAKRDGLVERALRADKHVLAAVRRGRPLESEGSLAVRVVAALQRSLDRVGSPEVVGAPARRLPNVAMLRGA
jgi:hypothetical protein